MSTSNHEHETEARKWSGRAFILMSGAFLTTQISKLNLVDTSQEDTSLPEYAANYSLDLAPVALATVAILASLEAAREEGRHIPLLSSLVQRR